MKNKFFTQSGWLTRYAMACGYRHETKIGQYGKKYHVILAMNNAELNTFEVRTFTENWDDNQWYVVEGINAARHIYKQCTYTRPDKRYESNTDIARTVFA